MVELSFGNFAFNKPECEMTIDIIMADKSEFIYYFYNWSTSA